MFTAINRTLSRADVRERWYNTAVEMVCDDDLFGTSDEKKELRSELTYTTDMGGYNKWNAIKSGRYAFDGSD